MGHPTICLGHSIGTVWHGDVTPRRPRLRTDLPLVGTGRAPLRLSKGAEMGRFNMGSTVITLFQPGMMEWFARYQPGNLIDVGRMLARLK